MSQNSFYEVGGSPYRPDTGRGQWARGSDFVYVCLAHAFKMDLVTWVIPFIFLRTSGGLAIWSVPFYLLCVAIFVVPIFLLQSYLGQFSSSSYISVFRLSPLFKGVGYTSCALNFMLLTYQSIFAGIPLIFLWNSFRSTLPWSCASHEKWTNNLTNGGLNVDGRSKQLPLSICTAPLRDGPHFINHVVIPSVQFLKSHFQHAVKDRLLFSWYLYLCLLLVWVIVGAIVVQRTVVVSRLGQHNQIAANANLIAIVKTGAAFGCGLIFGKIIRSLVQVSVVLLLVCLLRSLFLPTSWEALTHYFSPESRVEHWPQLLPVTAAITFSSGWGCNISMASFNRFRTNIICYSWLTCGLQVLLMLLLGLFCYLMESHMVAAYNLYVKGHFYKQHWELMLCIPSCLTDLELPHIWSITFFAMLLTAAVSILATQLHALTIALTDEFPKLRAHRSFVTSALISCLALASSFFCFNHSDTFFSALATDALFMQTSLNLLLIFIVLCVYGRTRFQLDLEFMLGHSTGVWLMYMLSVAAPICALFVLWFCYLAILHQHFMSSFGLQLVAVLFILLPWLLLPVYVSLQLLQTPGSVCMRCRRITRATEWFPLELEDRWRYIELMGDLDSNQQLELTES